jgi:hypothetical protein
VGDKAGVPSQLSDHRQKCYFRTQWAQGSHGHCAPVAWLGHVAGTPLATPVCLWLMGLACPVRAKGRVGDLGRQE